MIKPHIHVPYDSLDKHLSFITQGKLDLEIYFGTRLFDSLSKKDIASLKKKLDYGPGITVHAPFMDLSPGAVDDRVREVTIKRFSDVIELSEILRPKVIVFHSGYDKWKYDSRVDIWLEESLKTWRVINRKAGDAGVRIAIENIFEEEPSHLKLLSDEMSSDNFGLCFDAGHFNLFSKVTLLDWLGQVKQYIIELHLHDNMGNADSHFAIGDGNFDFKTLFKEFKGKDCVCTLEAHSVEDARKSMERFKEYFN